MAATPAVQRPRRGEAGVAWGGAERFLWGENGVDRRGGRPKEKSRGLTVGAGSGLAAVSGRVCLRAAGGVGSSAEAGGPRRVPRLHRPPEQSYEVLAFSKIVKN